MWKLFLPEIGKFDRFVAQCGDMALQAGLCLEVIYPKQKPALELCGLPEEERTKRTQEWMGSGAAPVPAREELVNEEGQRFVGRRAVLAELNRVSRTILVEASSLSQTLDLVSARG